MDKLRWYQASFVWENFGTGELVVEIHWFPAEENPTRSTYRASTSMNWFNERQIPLGIHVLFEPMRAVMKGESIRKARATEADPYRYQYDDCPHFYHKDLWAFYACIGYAYKKKKWGTRPALPPAMTHEQLRELCYGVDVNYADFS